MFDEALNSNYYYYYYYFILFKCLIIYSDFILAHLFLLNELRLLVHMT